MVEDRYLIRPLRQNAEDLQALASLELKCAQGSSSFKFCLASDPPRHTKYTQWLALVCEDRKTGLIVGGVAANVRWVLFGRNFEKVSWIFNLRVDSEHRRNGLGVALVEAIERKLRLEHDVTFVYAGISSVNYTSQCLFQQKLGYKPTQESQCYGVNLGHVIRLVANHDDIATMRLDGEESEAFLRQHFGDSFFFPSDRNPADCLVYVANIDGQHVAAAVTKKASVFTLVKVSLWFRVKNTILTMLSYLMPNHFERPLQLGKPWRTHPVMPFRVDLNDPAMFEPLFNALMAAMVRDFHGKADTLMAHLAPLYCKWQDDRFAAIARQSKWFSKTLFKDSGALVINAKSLLENDEMLQFALKQPFWFIDGKEL